MARSLVVPLLLLGVAGDGSLALAQSAGTFTATGSMTLPRGAHTATLLSNGKVLITGGYTFTGFNRPVSSAELYDPSTGTFTRTGDMITARRSHTATLLPNGQVLISGGASANNAQITSAELYDPSTGTFTATGGSSSTSAPGAATLLPNGKVLFASRPNAELYDPLTGAFTGAGMYVGPIPGFNPNSNSACGRQSVGDWLGGVGWKWMESALRSRHGHVQPYRADDYVARRLHRDPAP